MANFTAADVKKLRELTGSGMMDCKKALDEAGGEVDKAVELLRIKGAKDVGKRAERTAGNGLVTARLSEGFGVLLELNCETDFVAKLEKFQDLAESIVDFVARTRPSDVPSALAAEIEPGKSVQQLIDETSANIGEKLELRRFATLDGGHVGVYLHKSDPNLPPTVGVLVQLDTENAQVVKDVAQQIAAMAPKYLTREDVPADLVAKEREIAEQTAREEGKPEAALVKITEGRVNSFFKDNTLLEQPFVKENKKSVKQYVAEAGVEVKGFARFKVGSN